MGDFLSRLTERTLERAEVARPVIAPAFASIPHTPAEEPISPVERERSIPPMPPGPAEAPRARMASIPDELPARRDDARVRSAIPPAPEPTRAIPTPIPHADDRRAETPRRADPATGDAGPHSAPIEIRIVEREIVGGDAPRTAEEPSRADDRRGFLLPPIPHEPRPEPRGRDRRDDIEERTETTERRGRAIEEKSVSDTSRRMPPSRESGEEMSRREPPPFPHLVALEPEPPARIEPMAATLEDRGRREESRPQTSPQTIQVTIGRIEVKATSPATRAPRPERKGAHVMSLDDYMRQRAGGGR